MVTANVAKLDAVALGSGAEPPPCGAVAVVPRAQASSAEAGACVLARIAIILIILMNKMIKINMVVMIIVVFMMVEGWRGGQE